MIDFFFLLLLFRCLLKGHDTTTAAISWALYLIGSHDDVQVKIVKEMNRIFGDDKSKIATIHQLNDMKYLEQVLKEALRLFPSGKARVCSFN